MSPTGTVVPIEGEAAALLLDDALPSVFCVVEGCSCCVGAACCTPVPTRITFSTGAFLTYEVKVFDEITLSPERVTRFVFSRMPS